MSDCNHTWSDDYVCESCGAVKTGCVPMWLWTCSSVRGGPRAILMALWVCADRNTRDPAPVFPSNRKLRELTGGLARSQVQRHLSTLRAHGWIREVELPGGRRGFDLAWLDPFEVVADAPPCETAAAVENNRGPDSRAGGPGFPGGGARIPGPIPMIYLRSHLRKCL